MQVFVPVIYRHRVTPKRVPNAFRYEAVFAGVVFEGEIISVISAIFDRRNPWYPKAGLPGFGLQIPSLAENIKVFSRILGAKSPDL